MRVEFADGDNKTVSTAVIFDNGDEDVESYSPPVANCYIISLRRTAGKFL